MTRTTYIRLTAIIATITFIAVIGVCIYDFVSVKQRVEESIQEADSLSMLALDVTQTDRIGGEITKARKHKDRKPKTYTTEAGQISPFDDLFKTYSKEIGWDWRLLAAISYVESRFHPEVVSRSGAKGLMQLMPKTAMNYGCPDSLLQDPEDCIKAGTALLKDLEQRFRKRNVDHDLIYFTLAGFHAGLGHIYEAMTMADSLGYDHTLWHDNVELCLQLKADPEYFNLPYVRLGRFNGKVTSAYINEVLDYQAAFKKAK